MNSYFPGGQKEKELTKLITYMLAVDKLPVSFVERPGFRALMGYLAKSYKVPSRRTFTQRLREAYDDLKVNAQERIKLAKFVSLTADYWTDLNQRSYLGESSIKY